MKQNLRKQFILGNCLLANYNVLNQQSSVQWYKPTHDCQSLLPANIWPANQTKVQHKVSTASVKQTQLTDWQQTLTSLTSFNCDSKLLFKQTKQKNWTDWPTSAWLAPLVRKSLGNYYLGSRVTTRLKQTTWNLIWIAGMPSQYKLAGSLATVLAHSHSRFTGGEIG